MSKKGAAASNDLTVSFSGLKDLIWMSIGDVVGDEAVEALKNFALEIIRKPAMENKDEIILVIINSMESKNPQWTKNKLVMHLAVIYDAITDYSSCNDFRSKFPQSKKVLAEMIFDRWNPGDFSIFSIELIALMNRIYDQSDEKVQKSLDEKFKKTLDDLDEDMASHWLMADGLTEGLGNHLAKCRTRAGGFQLALRDVQNANFLHSGINQLTAGALLEVTKAYDALCLWDQHVVNYCYFLKEDFAEISYQCDFVAKYDYSKSNMVVTLNISPMENCPAISASALLKYIDRKFSGKTKECFRTSDGVHWPKDISVEVFLGCDRIAQITV